MGGEVKLFGAHLEGQDLAGGALESHSFAVQHHGFDALLHQAGDNCCDVRVLARIILAVPAASQQHTP